MNLLKRYEQLVEKQLKRIQEQNVTVGHLKHQIEELNSSILYLSKRKEKPEPSYTPEQYAKFEYKYNLSVKKNTAFSFLRQINDTETKIMALEIELLKLKRKKLILTKQNIERSKANEQSS